MQSFDFIPLGMIELIHNKKSRYLAKSADPLVELDTDAAQKRAIAYLRGPAPKAIAFEGGNDTTYRVAARVREFGISEGAAFDLIGEHWNEIGKADPPWGAEELQTIIGNAYAYATAGWGGMSGLAEGFEPAEILELPKEVKRGLYRVLFQAAKADALKQIGTPLIKGVLNLGSMAVLYGASGSGKTFLMLDIAFHIAAGLLWQGHKVTQGVVLYLAAEGGRGIFKRIAALANHYNAKDVPLDIVPCPINLLSSKADMQQLLALVKEAEAEHGQPVRMIVIDTLSRALAGGDENTSTDMGAFVKNVDKLRDATGATLAIVHHSGKDTAKGARGWSGLRAATDTEIEIVDGTIRVSKQRDIDPIEDMRFKLERITIGKDQDGEIETSCWVRFLKKHETVRLELGDRGKIALRAFNTCLESSASGTVLAGRWDDQIRIAGLKLSERTLRDLRQDLATSGWVKKDKQGQYVSLGPAEPAEPAKAP